MSWIKGFVRPLAALAVLGLLALPAAAQTIYNPLTTNDLASLLKSQGYDAEIDDAHEKYEGDYINSKIGNINFWIHFTACDEDGSDCEAIVFDAGFTYNAESKRPTLEKINDWNEHNLGKAGLDKEGDPYINIEINIVGGLTRDNMIDNITWWKNMLDDFTDEIDWG